MTERGHEPWRELRDRLASQQPLSCRGANGFRLEWLLPAMAPEGWIRWMRQRNDGSRWFWQAREGHWQLGLGQARRVDLSAPDARLPAEIRGLLIWPFSSSPENGDWGELAHPRLLEPRFHLCGDSRGLELSWTCDAPDTASALARLQALLAEPVSDRPSRVLKAHLLADSSREQWNQGVARILEGFDSGALEKCVLSCWRDYQWDAAPDVFELLERLPADQGTRLVVAAGDAGSFLALSPEKLYRRGGHELWCDALAGTRQAGHATASPDLESELMDSDKDRREQALVSAALVRELREAGATRIDCGPVHTSQAGSLLHLRSTVHAGRTPDSGDLALVRTLHPTPALCGTPREAARTLLASLESHSRGLYGGLVGPLSPDWTELSVGIRSARLQGRTLRLYAGAGLVPGSDVDAEWQETRHKLAVLESALGLQPESSPRSRSTLHAHRH